MSLGIVGQRCVSEREPELGLGVVARVEPGRILVAFPATQEQRLYALGTPVLKRVRFGVGETVATRDGRSFEIAEIVEADGLVTYVGGGQRVREDGISDVTSVASPAERLLAGQADEGEVFALRYKALQARARYRASDVRGFLGGRIDLIPHQFHVVNEVARRRIPRVLLADEVGLGKTIEACLIIQRLLAVGRARRVLVLVPETLTHQWFVELLRRFNLWFSIVDEERCAALEASDPGKNPFLASQLALAATGFLAADPNRQAQALEAGWDLIVVDEAHHLAWSPTEASPAYQLVEALAARTPGLLLLTATPTQLGLEGHFARLRLLDPQRYGDFAAFVEETRRYGEVAAIAGQIVEGKALKAKDRTALARIFDRDPEGLARHLEALADGRPGAREALLRTLLDQHGTGRVVFRNTRAAMTGFPQRRYCPAPVVPPEPDPVLLARIARELKAEETGAAGEIRYAFKDDPRIAWLTEFLLKHRSEKVLLICRSQRKVLALEAALKERINVNTGVFHEGLPLVQRDRQAAWFAEPAGAQLLLCSEIGSEGRNFQFAHHLVLFDLPLNPGLVEQRIGRLDRIGQTQTIRVHVPYVTGSADECVAYWYHHGLDAFEQPLYGGDEHAAAFRERLLALAVAYGEGAPVRGRMGPAERDALVAETAAFRAELAERMRRGRDRLLELASFDPVRAAALIERVRAADADPQPRRFLFELLDHFGVRVKEHEGGEAFLDPSHAYVPAFPAIPPDGLLATFDRARAIAREDIGFLSPDHPVMEDAISLLVDSPAGTTAFSRIRAKAPNLLLEAVFVVEAVADRRWQVDQYLAPTPVRVLLDVRGRDLTDERAAVAIAADAEDADLPRFLEQPGFNGAILKSLLAAAQEKAEARAAALKAAATGRGSTLLEAEAQRLADLRRLNDHVRPEEIALVTEELKQVRAAIAQARVRLDSIRLILEGPADHE